MNTYARCIVRHRVIVVVVALAITAVLAYFASGLRIVISPAAMAPQEHPYVRATQLIETVFGTKNMVLIGITPKEGDALQPAVLERVQRITQALRANSGSVRSSLMSLTAPRAKGILAAPDGFEARPLIEHIPATDTDRERIIRILQDNPLYLGSVISKDLKTAAIITELKWHSDGFRTMMAPIESIVRAEEGEDVSINVAGIPVYAAATERFAERINWLFPLAVLVIGLLHYEAFRTWQGFILPLVTALMAVAWGMGIMGLVGRPLDIFNSPTPILILAVAAGHAVQLLKRYYEEYENLRSGRSPLSQFEANREAVVRSMVHAGPVMIVAGSVAALGFLSLLVFRIETIRTFGLFTAIGIGGAVVLEMTFIPALRSMLRPPSDRDRCVEARQRIWDRIPVAIAEALLNPVRSRVLLGVLLIGLLICVGGISRIVINSDYRSFFADDIPVLGDDLRLSEGMGGTSALHIMFETDSVDAVKDPVFLHAIRKVEQYAMSLPQVGKVVSLVDFLERMHRALNNDRADPTGITFPETREGVAQYLLLYSMSGDPDDFDAYVDVDYQRTKMTLLLKASGSMYVEPLLTALEGKVQEIFAPFAGHVKISFGGDVAEAVALSDTMVHNKLINIAQISLAVFVISSIALRSPLAGILTLTPLAIAIAAVFGTMGWTGTPLNVPNSLIAAMAVGIGADYSIYLLFRMREFVQQGHAADDVLRRTFATAGKATLFVATAVGGGYGVLWLSWGFKVHQWLSGFIMIAMLVSALAALTMVPAAVVAWRPRFIFDTARQVVPRAMHPMLPVVAAVVVSATIGDSRPKSVDAKEWESVATEAQVHLGKDASAQERESASMRPHPQES